MIHEKLRDSVFGECDASLDYDLVIVDDDGVFATLITRQLRRSTKRYRIFNDSVDALCHLKKSYPHTLLIDFRMPVLDGVQLLRTLRDGPHESPENTIVYSSCLPPPDVQQTIISMQARLITKDQLLKNNALLHFLEPDDHDQSAQAGLSTQFSLTADSSGSSRKPPD